MKDDYRVASPCVRNCCLDQYDVCVGCYRTLVQITRWTSYSEAEKQLVLEECRQRKEQNSQRRWIDGAT